MQSSDALFKDLGEKVSLGADERVAVSCLARLPSLPRLETRPELGYGLLLLTNRRLVFIRAWPKGIALDKPLTDLAGVGLEANVMVGGELRTVLRLSYGETTELLDIGEMRPKSDTVEALVGQIRHLRASEIIRTQATPITDFGWLKDILEKGGVLVGVVKCPSCGGPLDLPSKGGSVKCSHCGTTAVVQQVVDIIKAVGLPNQPLPEK
ncbi:MAG: hypothetical protein JRM94_03205 [Nitrososphaerota archaeon]|nr:hypothetical protein [Nitrososphaerota archaeon]